MSTLLRTLLDHERRAECARYESGATAACKAASALQGADACTTQDTETQRIEPVPGSALQWVRFTCVPFRTSETPRRRRVDPPSHSRFGDLTP